MTAAVENIAEKLFKVIKGFGHTIVLFTDDGKKTVDPTEARRFFATDLQMMVNLIVDETTKEVAVNLSKDTDISDVKPMLNSIRKLANQFILNYTVKTFGKTIGPKDFSFMAKQKTTETTYSDNPGVAYRDTGDIKQYRGWELRRVQEYNPTYGGYGQYWEAYNLKKPADDGGPSLDAAPLSVIKGQIDGLLDESKKYKTNETVARSGASDYADTFSDNDTANRRAYKIGKQDAARGYERNSAKVGGGKRSKFYNAGFDGKPFRGAGKTVSEAREMTQKAVMKKTRDGEWEAMQDIEPGKHVEFRNTRSGKRFTIMVRESSWGGAQAEGTVKKLKDGGWWAKNQEGTMKTFKDEKAARRFAKTGDPDFAPKRVEETDQLNELTPRQKAMKQGAITDPPGGRGWSTEPTSRNVKRWAKNDPDDYNDYNDHFDGVKRAKKMMSNPDAPRGTASAYDKGVKAGKASRERNKNARLARIGNDREFYNNKHNTWDRADKRNRGYPVGKLPESVNEGFSGWHGSAMKSINELGDARLIVRHKRSVDEEKRGARTRQIESIFIENNEGERFKFPSNNITAAKAMVRHVKEGGTPYDDFGQYIYETMEELNQLKVFQRKNRRNDFFEDANISEEIGSRVTQLRSNLKQISGVKGYAHHFENFTREGAEIGKEKLDELKDNVTISYFDEAISGSLPYVARVIENMRGRQAREADIMDLAKYVMDNKDNIQLHSEIDETDPESPGNRKFRDPATAFAAWVTYIQSKIKDDVLANKLMQAADVIHEVGGQHVKMAAAALKVVRQNGQVSEGLGEEKKIDPKAMMGAIRAVKKYLEYEDKARRAEDAGHDDRVGRYRDAADEQSKQFFAIVAPETPEEDQDLGLYGFPEANKEWVMGWFEESTYESEVNRIDETLSRLSDTRPLFGA